MKNKSYGSLAFFIVLIIVFSISIGKAEQKAYDEGYAAAKEEYGNYEHHTESCDGSCDHVQYEIEDLVHDGELILKDDLYKTVRDSNEYYTEDEHWEALDADSYIQGYEDCYYGYDPAY